jgi:5'-3' exoribonuclease 2
MGVPAFYRWLSQKYPKIVSDVVEDEPYDELGRKLELDSSRANPNGLEFDNLYLDMNGIIHPCFHPEDRPAPTTEEEVFECIFDYIDRLFLMIRPRKVLYMAIDGVAPRAKMNQQRSRRFRSAQEAKEKAAEEEKLREKLIREGVKVPPKAESGVFDSNVITPGTPFMGRLSEALKYYVHDRLNNDPGWKGIEVIFSDASVPGEGEHKAMHYIRQQRGLPGWNPNTRHVVYGLDADLIMLALATHEPHFWILREIVFQKKDSEAPKTDGLGLDETKKKVQIARKPYQLLSVSVLREYLALDLKPTAALPFKLDPERLFDDYIFMCFFVGNDFLPHSPTLEIREGAIDLLMTLYRTHLPTLGGYLCADGRPNLTAVERFVGIVSQHEEAIFQKRAKKEAQMRSRRQRERQKAREYYDKQRKGSGTTLPAQRIIGGSTLASDRAPAAPTEDLVALGRGKKPSPAKVKTAAENKSAAEALRERLKARGKRAAEATADETEEDAKKAKTESDNKAKEFWNTLSEKAESDSTTTAVETENSADELPAHEFVQATGPDARPGDWMCPSGCGAMYANKGTCFKCGCPRPSEFRVFKSGEEMDTKSFKLQLESVVKAMGEREEEADNIRLGEHGWKERYYGTKMQATPQNRDEIIRGMVVEYVRGLIWVCRYYFEGCCSWGWFYPYHYAPFASDLVNLGDISTDFEIGKPFKPFSQLMGVLPAASSHALPAAFAPLMSDKDSPIIDFYPEDFELDMNGKRFTWQAVALLPWIDAKRLLEQTEALEFTLTAEEKRRNSINEEEIYVNMEHPLSKQFLELDEREDEGEEMTLKMDPKRSKGMNATLVSVKREAHPSTITSPMSNRQDINDNKVVVASMRLPTDRFVPPVLMEGTVLPTPVVSEGDLPPPPKLFHQDDYGGRQPRGSPTIDYGRGAAGHPLASGRGGGAGYQNQDARSLLQASLGRGVPLGGGMMNFQQRAPPPPPPMMMGGPPQGYPQGYPQARGTPPGPPGGVPVGYPAGIPPPGGRPPSNYAPGGNRFAALNNLPRRAPPGPPGGRPPSGSNPPKKKSR